MRNRVRELRQAKGLSQDEFGDKVGVSRQTVSSIEQGRYNPTLALALRVARYFKIPVEEVFLGDDQQ